MQRTTLALSIIASLWLIACDQQGHPLDRLGMDKLKPGQSTELDVRQVLGVPEMVLEEKDGSRVFQYPAGPEDRNSIFVTLGADGKMVRAVNVLVPDTFAKIRAGMSRDDVRLLLGKPPYEKPYPLKQQTAWEWKIVEGGEDKLFYVLFDAGGKVVQSGIDSPLRK